MRLFGVLFLLTLVISARAQFNSGSTGADGALNLGSMTCPNDICEVQVPESGILNFTTITVPSSPARILVFKRNSRNTPVILLAQGDVTIGGEINVSAPCAIAGVACSSHTPSSSSVQTAGVGGFSGGAPNEDGFGPGKGIASGDLNGRWVGPLGLVPVVGGSGAAGYTCGFPIFACLGGGGGGGIVIASSTSISVAGAIKANGSGDGSRGSGGAIRLVANSISITGQLRATGGANGVIRLEATDLTFTGTATPLATSAPINPTVVPVSSPQLTFTSIGGYSVPSYAGGRFDLIDLLLPSQIPDPVNVVVNAQNIPVGTEVEVGFVSGSPNGTSTPCSLAGTFASSACTATISNLNRTGGTYLLATAAFAPPSSLAKYNPKGRSRVVKIKLEAVVGGKPTYTFLRSDGTVIDPKMLSARFLKGLGM